MTISDAIHNIAPKPRTKLAKKLRPDAPTVPTHNDLRRELKLLTQQHARWTREARKLIQMVGPVRVFPTDGRPVADKGKLPTRPTDKPAGFVSDLKATQKQLKLLTKQLEKAMLVQLKQCPVFTIFLSRVYGIGPVVAAYIVANVDIRRAWQPSKLARYFGNRPGPTGRMERRVAGGAPRYAPDGTFDPNRAGSPNDTMRTILYQGMVAMRKNSAKFTRCDAHEAQWKKLKTDEKNAFRRDACASCDACARTTSPFGTTSKYLTRWSESLHTSRTMPYANPDGRPTNIDKKGRMKAADVFLEDLYVIMRAIEGLDVHPTYASVMRDRAHGKEGPVDNGRGVPMTVDEALALIGDFKARPATHFMFDAAVEDEDEEDQIAAE